MKKTVLRAYARLIAEVGARVQKGQDVVIEAELDQPEFVTMVADACYHAGARKVTVTWKHQALEKLAIRRESVKTLQTVEAWERAKLQHYVDTLPCRIYLLSEDPDGLRGVSPAKMARARQGRYSVIKPYRDQMEGRYQWCIAAVPGEKWAKKLFPELRASQAVEKLWEAILKTSRVTDDPIQAWEDHNRDLHDRCEYLNNLHIRELRYKSSNGTDFTVGMIPEAQFCGGGEYTIGGSYFNPNLPTEECFISPKRGEAEGVVYSSKPLSYQGQLIEDFSIRFEHGRAVEAHGGRIFAENVDSGGLRIVTLSVVKPGPGQQNRNQTPAAVTCLLLQRHCPVQGLLRWLQATLLLLAVRQGQQGLHAGRHIGLGRSIDRQGRQLLQIGLRLVMLAQARMQIAQGLERFFAQRQRDGICRQGLRHFESPPIALHCLARLLHGLLHIAQIPGHGCGVGMRAKAGLIQLQRLEQRLLGFGVVATGLLDQSEQIQTAGHIGPLPLALLLCQFQCLARSLLGGFIRLFVLLAQCLFVKALPLRGLSQQWRACSHADQQRQRHQDHLIQEGTFRHAPHHRQFTVCPHPTHLLRVKR